MSNRKLLIAGNWKMNPAPAGFDGPQSPYRQWDGIDIVIFPSFVDIPRCVNAGIITGGQWARPESTGAYTGDISMRMLKDAGCTYVLCGHSERRLHHGETDDSVAKQADAAIEAGLHPIVCIGETLEEREEGRAQEVVERQVRAMQQPVTLAYEPVWAIGTGKTATPEKAQEMHAFIRSLLTEQEATRILYGGSAKPDNAEALLAQADIDGLLVGGASLDPESFRAIVNAALKQSSGSR